MDYVVKLNKIITNFEKNDVWVLLDLHQVGGVPEMLCFFILLPPPPPLLLFSGHLTDCWSMVWIGRIVLANFKRLVMKKISHTRCKCLVMDPWTPLWYDANNQHSFYVTDQSEETRMIKARITCASTWINFSLSWIQKILNYLSSDCIYKNQDVASSEFGTYDGFPRWLVDKLRYRVSKIS